MRQIGNSVPARMIEGHVAALIGAGAVDAASMVQTSVAAGEMALIKAPLSKLNRHENAEGAYT